MATEIEKFVTEDLKSTTQLLPPGGTEYKNEAEAIPVQDRTIENAMPKGPDPNPFKLGPLQGGG